MIAFLERADEEVQRGTNRWQSSGRAPQQGLTKVKAYWKGRKVIASQLEKWGSLWARTGREVRTVSG